jgi:hypothetical protein
LVDYILDRISVSKNSAAIHVSAEKDNLCNHRGLTIGFTRGIDCGKLGNCKTANYDRSYFTTVLYFFKIGSDEIASVCAKRHNPFGAGIIRVVEFLCRTATHWQEVGTKTAEGGVRGHVGLAGVDVEAQDGVYFDRLVAAKYGAEFPVG